MLDAIVGIFSSSGLGAIVGLFGSWLTKREERRNLELKLTHETQMARIRKDEAEMEFGHELAMADKKIERAKVEGEIQRDVEEMAAFREGLKEQQMMYKIKFVDAIRGIMRPLITTYLLIIATYVAVKIGSHVGDLDQIDPNELLTMHKETINQIMFLVTTAVTWWFGSRPSSQRKA